MDVDGTAKRGKAPAVAPAAEPREILAAPGWANHPAWSPDGRWLAAIGVLDPEHLDDVMPDILVGPADGSRPPHALDPDLDRPIGNWTDTDLNGWMVDGRHGPAWLDDRRLVATVSDRGRSHPHVYTIDSKTGRLLERTLAATGDLTTHTLAVAPTPIGARRASPSSRRTARRPWTSTRPTAPTPPTRAADRPSARRGRTASRCRRCAASTSRAPAARSTP